MLPIKFKLKASLFLSLVFLIIYVTQPAAAQAPQTTATQNLPSPSASQPISQQEIFENIAPEVPKNLHTLSQSVIIEVLSGVVCTIAGFDPINSNGKCLGVNPKTGQVGYVTNGGGGLARVMGSLIGGTASIPISSVDYAGYAIDNFGITKSAYAQTNNGVGFDRLRPLLGVWVKLRDISYLAFVLAFTIIGLAIMFRVKIDPRTVMTIQNQIPKIIIALILITFSYAIAGFLIDLMYVSIYLVLFTFGSTSLAHSNINANVFSVVNKAFAPSVSNPLLNGASQIFYDVGSSGIMNVTYKMSDIIGSVLGSLTADFLNSTLSKLFKIPFLPFSVLDIACDTFGFLGDVSLRGFGLGFIPGVGDFLGGIPVVGGIFSGSGGCDFVDTFFQGTITFIFGVLAFLVILIALLFSLFRVWFTLIKSFIYVLLDVMLAPFWIAGGIFPGSKLGFGSWLKHITAHLAVFPTTFAVILLGKTIIDGIGSSQGDFFSPPLIGSSFGGRDTVAALVGFGFIMSLPGILEKTRTVIGALNLGLTDVKAGFKAGVGIPKEGIGAVAEYRRKQVVGGWHGVLSKFM